MSLDPIDDGPGEAEVRAVLAERERSGASFDGTAQDWIITRGVWLLVHCPLCDAAAGEYCDRPDETIAPPDGKPPVHLTRLGWTGWALERAYGLEP